MELYLNVIEYGPGIYGITAAADHYFKTTPAALSLGQALYLGSILPSPTQHHFTEAGPVSDGWKRYLQRLMEKFSGNVPLAAASYNAGPHRVQAWLQNFGSLDMDEFVEHIPFVETRNYVKKVVRNYQIYNLLYDGGGQSLAWLIKPVGVTLKDSAVSTEVW